MRCHVGENPTITTYENERNINTHYMTESTIDNPVISDRPEVLKKFIMHGNNRRNTKQSIQQSEDGKLGQSDSGFSKRRSVKNVVSVGRVDSSEDDKIKSVPKLDYLHVYRLDPQDIIDHLKQWANVLKCEKLKSRNSDFYSSYKMTIYEEDRNKLMSPTIWPRGVCVRRFFLRRGSQNESE